MLQRYWMLNVKKVNNMQTDVISRFELGLATFLSFEWRLDEGK